MSAYCAWCEAPRQNGQICPDCGADYAKAEAIKAKGSAESVLSKTADIDSLNTVNNTDPSNTEPEPIPVKDPVFEKKACIFALPAMLGIALFIQVTGFLSGMQRIVFAMPVHEFGHAVSGWLCGFNSIPTLWLTRTPENRGYASSLLLSIGLIMLARYGLKNRQPAWLVAVLCVAAMQFYGTVIISPAKADMLITMGGDAMGLMLATILMALFYVGKKTQLYQGALRWGFLAIGAAAFINMFMPWWNKDISAIGYGLTGGIPTDSWKLINIHLWQWNDLFAAHIVIGTGCLLSLTVIYVLGLMQASAWVKSKAKQERLRRLRNA